MTHIPWVTRLGFLVMVRNWATLEPCIPLESHVGRLAESPFEEKIFLRRFRRWCREMGLTERGNPAVHWERINCYLLPSAQYHRPSSPCRAHGAELLYAL